MLIICNDLTTEKDDIAKACKAKDSETIKKIAEEAKADGFNALELYAGNTEDEAENLIFLYEAIKETGLEHVVRVKEVETYEKILKVLSPGILAPVNISLSAADEVFPILMNLDDSWDILFTQTFGNDSVSSEVNGIHALVDKAEQEGMMPEKIYLEPLGDPILKVSSSFMTMKRQLDAFRNIYPDINFYLDLAFAAEGLVDQDILMNVFIGMADLIGVTAYAFGTDHKEHIKAIEAAEALLSVDGIKDYLKDE